MKKRSWKPIVSMVMCLMLVVSCCIVPASAASCVVLDGARVRVNGAEIMVNRLSDGTGEFSGELIVDAFKLDYPNVMNSITVHGPSGDTFKPGPLNAFPISASSHDYVLDYRIELSDGSHSEDITVRYDTRYDTLEVLDPADRRITVDGVEIKLQNIIPSHDGTSANFLATLQEDSAYRNLYMDIYYGPNGNLTESMFRPGNSVSFGVFCSRQGDNVFTFQIRFVESMGGREHGRITVNYDLDANDFVHPSP